MPKGGTLGLWQMPVRRETAEIVGTGAESGQNGAEVYDAASIFLYGLLPRSNGAREGIGMTLGMRPPSKREMVDAAAVEYPLSLPNAKPLQVDFAIAGNASFEVKATPFEGGEASTLFQRSPQGIAWDPVSVNLDQYAGAKIRLRFEARGSSGDAQWAEPTIIAGNPPQPPPFPPTGGEPKLLGRADGCDVRLWPGTRGVLDAPVGFLCGDRKLFFRGFRVRVSGDSLEEWRASTELLKRARSRQPAGTACGIASAIGPARSTC